MPTFKHKTNKKIILDEKSIITLDSKHKELECEFDKDKGIILPDLRCKKKHLNKLLENNDLSIEQRLEITDKIENIKNQIKQLKKKKKDYYLNNNQYIFDYFETVSYTHLRAHET